MRLSLFCERQICSSYQRLHKYWRWNDEQIVRINKTFCKWIHMKWLNENRIFNLNECSEPRANHFSFFFSPSFRHKKKYPRITSHRDYASNMYALSFIAMIVIFNATHVTDIVVYSLDTVDKSDLRMEIFKNCVCKSTAMQNGSFFFCRFGSAFNYLICVLGSCSSYPPLWWHSFAYLMWHAKVLLTISKWCNVRALVQFIWHFKWMRANKKKKKQYETLFNRLWPHALATNVRFKYNVGQPDGVTNESKQCCHMSW